MKIALIAAGVIIVYAIFLYNRLLGMRNQIQEAFAALEVYLQNRHDALVKLAEVVVEYTKYEKGTLTEITKIREGLNNSSESEKLKGYEELNGKLRGIRLQAENYPDLKASKNFLHLQETAGDLEEKLSAARRTYNSNVVAFNTAIGSFPALLLAGVFGFREKSLYEVPAEKKEDVSMKQLLNG